MVPRLVERLVARSDRNPAPTGAACRIARLPVRTSIRRSPAKRFDRLAKEIETHEIAGDRLAAVQDEPHAGVGQDSDRPRRRPLYLSSGGPGYFAGRPGRERRGTQDLSGGQRSGRPPPGALGALVSAARFGFARRRGRRAGRRPQSHEMRGLTLAAIGRAGGPWVSKVVWPTTLVSSRSCSPRRSICSPSAPMGARLCSMPSAATKSRPRRST